MTETKSADQVQVTGSIIGHVVSNKMHKTIVVKVEGKVRHPVYGKYVKHTSKMYVHDEENSSCVGDIVRIQETRPLSKTKRWKLVEILKREEQE